MTIGDKRRRDKQEGECFMSACKKKSVCPFMLPEVPPTPLCAPPRTQGVTTYDPLAEIGCMAGGDTIDTHKSTVCPNSPGAYDHIDKYGLFVGTLFCCVFSSQRSAHVGVKRSDVLIQLRSRNKGPMVLMLQRRFCVI